MGQFQIGDEGGEGNVAPIIRIAHVIIEYALRDNASEIHITAGADKMEVHYKIDGVMLGMMTLSQHIHPKLAVRYKIMAETSWASRDRPVKGRFAVCYRRRHYECSLTLSPTPLGEEIIISIT